MATRVFHLAVTDIDEPPAGIDQTMARLEDGGQTFAAVTNISLPAAGSLNGGVDLEPTPNALTFNVTPVNDAPSGTDAAVTVLEGVSEIFAAADLGLRGFPPGSQRPLHLPAPRRRPR